MTEFTSIADHCFTVYHFIHDSCMCIQWQAMCRHWTLQAILGQTINHRQDKHRAVLRMPYSNQDCKSCLQLASVAGNLSATVCSCSKRISS